MANEIVKDFQGGQNAVERSPDPMHKSGWDAFLGALGGAVEGVGTAMSRGYGLKGSGGGSGSDKQKKDYTPIVEAFQKLRDKALAGGPNYERQRVDEDTTVKSLLGYYYTIEDIKKGQELAGYTPIVTMHDAVATQIMDYQKSSRDIIYNAGASLLPYGATEEEIMTVGANAIAVGDSAKSSYEAYRASPDKREAERMLLANINNLHQETQNAMSAAVAKYGYGSEVVASFKANRITALQQEYSLPYQTAFDIVTTALKPFDAGIEAAKKDIENAESINKSWLNFIQDGTAARIMTRTFTFDNPADPEHPVQMTGAQTKIFQSLFPEQMKTLANSNMWKAMAALSSNGSIAGFTKEDYNGVFRPGMYASIASSKVPQETKNNTGTIVKDSIDKLVEDVVNTPKDVLRTQRQEFKASDAINNVLDGFNKELINSIPALSNNREELSNNMAKAISEGMNALTDGEGIIVVDKQGNQRYMRVQNNIESRGIALGRGVKEPLMIGQHAAVLVDDTHAGWLVPWGDQDAIAARDSGRTEVARTIRNMAKLVGTDKAIELFNRMSVMNSKAFKEYADAKRRTAAGDIVASSYVVPMTEAEADEILKEIQTTPVNKTLDTLRDIKGYVIDPIKEGFKAPVKAIEEAIGSLGDLFSTNSSENTEALKEYYKSRGIDVDKLVQPVSQTIEYPEQASGLAIPPVPGLRPFGNAERVGNFTVERGEHIKYENNPFNLKVPGTNRFRKFKSIGEAVEAARDDAEIKLERHNGDVMKLCQQYAPRSDNNLTSRYCAGILYRTEGVSEEDKQTLQQCVDKVTNSKDKQKADKSIENIVSSIADKYKHLFYKGGKVVTVDPIIKFQALMETGTVIR